MDAAVTVTFVPQQIVTWLIIGLIAGYLSSLLIRGDRRVSPFTAVAVGLVGALLGGVLFSFLRIPISPALNDGVTLRYIDIIVAFVGALLFLVVLGGTRRRF